MEGKSIPKRLKGPRAVDWSPVMMGTKMRMEMRMMITRRFVMKFFRSVPHTLP